MVGFHTPATPALRSVLQRASTFARLRPSCPRSGRDSASVAPFRLMSTTASRDNKNESKQVVYPDTAASSSPDGPTPPTTSPPASVTPDAGTQSHAGSSITDRQDSTPVTSDTLKDKPEGENKGNPLDSMGLGAVSDGMQRMWYGANYKDRQQDTRTWGERVSDFLNPPPPPEYAEMEKKGTVPTMPDIDNTGRPQALQPHAEPGTVSPVSSVMDPSIAGMDQEGLKHLHKPKPKTAEELWEEKKEKELEKRLINRALWWFDHYQLKGTFLVCLLHDYVDYQDWFYWAWHDVV